MALPHSLLIELAAGRPALWSGRDGWELVRSAREHRMTGILWSRATELGIRPESPEGKALAADYDRNWARQEIFRARVPEILEKLAAGGFEVALAKGIPAEDRWYGKSGERPSQDIDLWLAPKHHRQVEDVIRALQPDHFLADGAQALADGRHISEIDLRVAGVPVDMHVGLFGPGLPLRRPEAVWERTSVCTLRDGSVVTTLDPEMSLILFVIHLNKDGFPRLLGYADIARILRHEEIDWSIVERFLRIEGLEVLFYSSLAAVAGDLGLNGLPTHTAGGLRASIHRALWPPRRRLRGDVSRLKRRQFWLPFLIAGRFWEAVTWWVRRLLPPRKLVAYYSFRAGSPGRPYLRAVLFDRVRRARPQIDGIHED